MTGSTDAAPGFPTLARFGAAADLFAAGARLAVFVFAVVLFFAVVFFFVVFFAISLPFGPVGRAS